jgi:hypothetical protein
MLIYIPVKCHFILNVEKCNFADRLVWVCDLVFRVKGGTGLRVFENGLLPEVYGSECWVLTENIKQKLLVFERKILRRIFGPTQKANGQ